MHAHFAILFDASGTLLGEDRSHECGVSLLPDAQKILDVLATRKIGNTPIRTGLITNWGNKIHTIVEKLEIADCFDIIISSETLLKFKPDPEIFKYACDFLGVELKNSFFIGDSLFDDALGAQRAGLQSIWLDRSLSSGKSPSLLEDQKEELKRPPVNNLHEVLSLLSHELS